MHAVLASVVRICAGLLAPAVVVLSLYLMAFLTLNSRPGSAWLSDLLTRVLPGTLHYTHLEIGANLQQIDIYGVWVDDPNGRRVIDLRHLGCAFRLRQALIGRLEFEGCEGDTGRILVEPYPPQGEIGFITAFGGDWSGKDRDASLYLLFDGIELRDIDVIVSLDDLFLRFDRVSISQGRVEAVGDDLRMDATAEAGGGRVVLSERMFSLGDGKRSEEAVAWDLLRRQRPWSGAWEPIRLPEEGGGWLDLPLDGFRIEGFRWRDNAFRVSHLVAEGPAVSVVASGWTRLVSDDLKRLPPEDGGLFFDGRASLRVPPTSTLFDFFVPGLLEARPDTWIEDLVFDGVGNVQFYDGGRTRLAFGDLSILGWPVRRFEAEVSFEDDFVVLHPGARLEIWEGVVSGSGALRTTDGVWNLDLCVDRIAPDSLLAPFLDAPIDALAEARLSSTPAVCFPTGPGGLQLSGDLSSKAFELAPAATTPPGKELMASFLVIRADGLRLAWPRAPSFLLGRDVTADLRATLTPRGVLRLRRPDGTAGLRLQTTGLRADVHTAWNLVEGRFSPSRVQLATADVAQWLARFGVRGVPSETRTTAEIRFAGAPDELIVDSVTAELRRDIADLDFPEFTASLRGGVSGEDLRIDSFSVQSSIAAGRASGRMGLFGGSVWETRSDPTVALDVQVERLRLGAFGLRMGPSAQVSAAFRLGGSLSRPRIRGESMEATSLQIAGEPVERVAAGPFEADHRTLRIENLELTKGDGRVTGALDWSFDHETIDLTLRGRRLRFEDFRLVSDADIDLRGALRFDVQARGRLADLDVEGSVVAENVRYQRIPLGGIGLAIDTWDGAVRASGGMSGDTSLRISAPLDGRPLHVQAALQGLELRNYFPDLRDTVARSSIDGSVDVTVDWNDDARVSGTVELDQIELEVGDRTFEASRPARFRFAAGGSSDASEFVIDQLALVTGEREAVLRGRVRSDANTDTSEMSASLSGDVDLSLLRFLPDLIADAEGNALVSLKLFGPVDAPELQGTIELGASRVAPRGLGTSVFLRPGTIQVTTDALVFPEEAPLFGSIYNGEFQLHGRVGLAGMVPSSADLHAFVSNLQYRIPEELNMTLAGQLRFEAPTFSDAATWKLSGDIDVVDARYYRRFDLLGGGLAFGGIGRTVDAFAEPIWQAVPELGAMQAELRIVGRDRFRMQASVTNLQFDIELRTELDLRGRFGAMELFGEMEALEGSRVVFRGRPFEVRRLFVSFRGDRDAQGFPMPWLDAELLASIRPCVRRQRDSFAILDANQTGITEVPNVLLTAWVDGRFPDRVDFRLESTPFYDQRDQLSLVLTGCTVDELTAGSAGAPTLDIVLRPVIEAVEQSVEDRFNVDSVDLIPTTDGTAGIQIIDELSVRFRWALDAVVGQGSATRQSLRGEYRFFDWLILEVQEQSSDEETVRFDGGVRFRLLLD
jgi:hypothetical protein